MNPEQKHNDKVEPMTIESLDRLCLYPIQHPKLFKNYEDQLNRFWVYNEINFATDYSDWLKMHPDEQYYISKTLAFFANSDNAVMENIENRYKEIQWPEARLALGMQSMMEGIHVVSYNNMISAVIKDPEERQKLFHAVKYDPIIAKKIAWMQKWAADKKTPLHQCFVAQCFSEGIGFSPNFASILWLRKNNKCSGICFGNEKIIPDETLHVKLFALLASMCSFPIPVATCVEMCREIVEIECEFVDDRLPYNLQGMNKQLMKQYVHSVADNILGLLNIPPIYNVANPFDFMELAVNALTKDSFFEKSVSDYQKTMKEDFIKSKSFKNLGQSIDF